jgi:hypothetical protein
VRTTRGRASACDILERSPAFKAEVRFLAACDVVVKLIVRQGALQKKITLASATERRTYDGELPRIREGLASTVARELDLLHDVHARDRVERAMVKVLRPALARVREEIRRQASDPSALHDAFWRNGRSRKGAAVAAVRANIQKLDESSVATVVAARAAGERQELRGALKVVDRVFEGKALPEASIRHLIDDEMVRHVMSS